MAEWPTARPRRTSAQKSVAALWERAAVDFSSAARSAYGPRLHRVVLYGSRARRAGKKGSDVDLLVVLDDVPRFWPELRRLERLAYRASFARGRPVVLSPFPVRRADYDASRTPFLRAVRREGRPL